MREIFTWIVNAIWFVVENVGLIVIGIAIFSQIWPYISCLVKFFAVAIPIAGVYLLWSIGEVFAAICTLIIGVVVVGGLWLLFQFLDNQFGVLMTEEEAIMEGYL